MNESGDKLLSEQEQELRRRNINVFENSAENSNKESNLNDKDNDTMDSDHVSIDCK